MLSWCILVATCAAPSLRSAEQRACELRLEANEHWWAGVISESHRMPFTAETQFESISWATPPETKANRC